MKSFFVGLLLLLVASSAMAQNGRTINQLGAGTALTGTELVPMFQVHNPAVTTTPSALKTYIIGSFASQNLTMSGVGPSASNSLFRGFGNINGTCTNGGCELYLFGANSYAVNTGSASNTVTNTRVYTNLGGANQVGGFNNLDTTLFINQTTGNASNAFYQAFNSDAVANVNDGGGSGTERGSLFGTGNTAKLETGATSWIQAIAAENDLSIQTGASALYSGGVSVVLLNDNAVAATRENFGFMVSAQTGATATIDCAYCIGGYQGANPLAASASIMAFRPNGGAGAGPTITDGIDLSKFTFTGAAFIGPTTTKILATGAGVIQFGNGTNGVGAQIADCANTCTSSVVLTGGAGGSAFISSSASGASLGLRGGPGTAGVFVAPQADNNIAFRIRNAALNTVYLNVDTSAGQVSLPQVPTGTPVASLCIDASNNIIKKTTTGPCV